MSRRDRRLVPIRDIAASAQAIWTCIGYVGHWLPDWVRLSSLTARQPRWREGSMLLRFVTAVLAVAAVTSSPALACMGPTVIFADNFQSADPAWGSMFGSAMSISSGQAQLTVPATKSGAAGAAFYGGMFVDSGDYCIDVVGPAVADPTTALGGIIFGMGDSEDFYLFAADQAGRAEVLQDNNGKALFPVQLRATPLLKQGTVTNTLRVVWKGTSVMTYINGQPFAAFNLPEAFINSKIGLFADSGTSASVTYKFSNLKITSVP
jgi:hypothetical protein